MQTSDGTDMMPSSTIPAALPPIRVFDCDGTRPVLALHCSLAHGGAWSPLSSLMRGVTIHAPDQPGHGRGDPADPKRILHDQGFDQSVAVALQLAGGTAVDIVGHSFGATLALRIALEVPDLVRSLTLVEPVLFAAAQAASRPEYEPLRTRQLAVAALISAGQPEAALRMFHADWGSGEGIDDLQPRLRAYLLDRIHLIPMQNQTLLDDQAGLLRKGGLESIRVPVLFVEGGASPPIISAVHDALIARIAHAGRLTVPGAGHMVPITHAKAVAPRLQRHLDDA